MAKGVPLPAALSGIDAQRLVQIDEALLYLVAGALAALADTTPLIQTGTLTPDEARAELVKVLNAIILET